MFYCHFCTSIFILLFCFQEIWNNLAVLLDKLIDAVLKPEKAYSQLLLNKVPGQYEMQSADTFTRIQAVIDYISGMTDVYALDLYRKINGMSLPAL